MALKEIYDLGEEIPLGQVPKRMHAFAIRQDRFGEPMDAWKREIIDVPKLGPKDVLVYVMATGINYNKQQNTKTQHLSSTTKHRECPRSNNPPSKSTLRARFNTN